MESEGIATVCISFVPQISQRVRPPRALLVPGRGGYTLGRPGDAAGQRRRLRAALRLLETIAQAGTLVDEATLPALCHHRGAC